MSTSLPPSQRLLFFCVPTCPSFLEVIFVGEQHLRTRQLQPGPLVLCIRACISCPASLLAAQACQRYLRRGAGGCRVVAALHIEWTWGQGTGQGTGRVGQAGHGLQAHEPLPALRRRDGGNDDDGNVLDAHSTSTTTAASYCNRHWSAREAKRVHARH